VPEPPLILVTNDDGLGSPGLHAAAEAWQMTAQTDWMPSSPLNAADA
jgi:broad specificity polyphosphatase/5'/3'-nucleotidase SurE